MSQLILDEQLNLRRLLPVISKWITVQPLSGLRPGEQIRDDRVPEILRALNQPTLVTIDHDFWSPRWCHPGYCVLYFAMEDHEQVLLPGLLRTLLQHPEFRTRAHRRGKVARVSTVAVEFRAFRVQGVQRLSWPESPRRTR
jgi:hypothetical protein